MNEPVRVIAVLFLGCSMPICVVWGLYLWKRYRSRPQVRIMTGILTDFEPAKNRPGCILKIDSGERLESCYAAMSPHEIHMVCAIGEPVSIQVKAGRPSKNGIYEALALPWKTVCKEKG